jgi:hypothetical protein
MVAESLKAALRLKALVKGVDEYMILDEQGI